MKFNWGTGIFLVIVLFLGLCSWFFIWSQNIPLSFVESDYYQKELRYEDKINEMRHVASLRDPLWVKVEGDFLNIHFPADLAGKGLSGIIQAYRPSDEKLDIKVPVAPDSLMSQRIPINLFTKGRYTIKLSWTTAGQGFFTTKEIYIP